MVRASFLIELAACYSDGFLRFCNAAGLVPCLRAQRESEKPYILCGLFTVSTVRTAVSQLPPCPKCNSEYTYEDGAQLVRSLLHI
ncbi:hypothetical protein [Salmonella enterica]|uniref:hypothetical protein n=1 Tax=Salmonella enterica TaxID=28901 RepID=UPI003D7C1E93